MDGDSSNIVAEYLNNDSELGKNSARNFVDAVNENILFPLIALLSAVAILYFLWGAFQFIVNADNEQGRATGRQHMLYGIIGLLIMFSAYTILQITANTFGLGDIPN